MSKLYSMPLHISDYNRDTEGLSMIEHGCYFNLMRAYWNNGGPISSDIKFLKRISGAQTKKETQICVEIASKYFLNVDGLLYHKRIDEEIRMTEERSRAARESAIARWEKRTQKVNATALRTQCGRNANLNLNLNHNNIIKDNNIIKNTKKDFSINSKLLQEKFEEFWEAYGKIGNKKPAFINFQKVIKQGVSYESIFRGLERYKAYIAAKPSRADYVKHASTWLEEKTRGWEDDYCIKSVNQQSNIDAEIESIITRQNQRVI